MTLHRILLTVTLWLSTLGSANVASAAEHPGRYLKKPDAWFSTGEAKQVVTNILSYQSELGGWPKNVDTTASPFLGDRNELKPTFDNSATTDELRILARYYRATREERCRRAFERGYE